MAVRPAAAGEPPGHRAAGRRCRNGAGPARRGIRPALARAQDRPGRAGKEYLPDLLSIAVPGCITTARNHRIGNITASGRLNSGHDCGRVRAMKPAGRTPAPLRAKRALTHDPPRNEIRVRCTSRRPRQLAAHVFAIPASSPAIRR
jgi:hypothetical protein